MKRYVIVTGLIFALLTMMHVWRMIEEPHLARDPWFLFITIAAAGLSLGAWRVVRGPTP